MCQSSRILACALLGGVSIGLLAPGCDDKRATNVAVPQPGNEDVAKRAVAQPVGPPPLSDEQCRAFAAAMEKAVASGDAAAVNALIDWDRLLLKAVEGIDAPVTLRVQFVAGAKQGARGPSGPANMLITKVKEGGTFRLLRIHSVGTGIRALFRLLMPLGEVNYLDMVLLSWSDGTAKASDLYVFSTGEMFSETVRRAYLPLVGEASKGLLETLTGSQSDFVKSLPQRQEMTSCLRKNEFQRALDIYGRLPESVKKDKSVLILRIRAAQRVSPAEFLAAFGALESTYPNDPCTNVFSIDALDFQGRHTDVIRAIDRLDQTVGGDPYLHFLRAGTYLTLKDNAKARAESQKAIDEEPTLVAGYFASVRVSLSQKDFKETNRLFALIEKQFGTKFGDLTSVPMYAEYVKSAEYQEWLKSHPQAPAKAPSSQPNP